MSMQDKLNRRLEPFKRKIFDEKIPFNSNSTKLIRLVVEENKFGDEDLYLESHELIEMNFTNLEGIPLSKLRQDLTQSSQPQTTGLYLYDVLPIEVQTKFEYDLQRGDILIRPIQDKNYSSHPFFLTLRIAEILGSFGSSITQITYQCAPYTDAFPDEIIQVIEDYQTQIIEEEL